MEPVRVADADEDASCPGAVTRYEEHRHDRDDLPQHDGDEPHSARFAQ